MFTSSEFYKTTLRNTHPSFLPAAVICKVDRLIVPVGKLWKGLQESIKRLMQSAFLVALLPVLLVMVDPLFNGYFYNGNVMTFEEYQRYLQSTLFWSTTFLIFCLNALRCHYFSRLAIYVRDRQRDQEITGKD